MKNKKNFALVIIVLSILLISIGTFMSYNNSDNNNNNQKEENNIQKEESENDSQDDTIVNDEENNNKEDENIEDNDEQENNQNNDLDYPVNSEISTDEVNILNNKIKVINNYIAPYFPVEDISKIPNQQLLVFGYVNAMNTSSTPSKIEIENVLKNYFGNEFTVKHESIICNIDNSPIYKYDESTQTYLIDDQNNHGHGGSGIYPFAVNTFYIENITKENDEYKINAKVVYGVCDDICAEDYIKYYSSYNEINNSNKKLYDAKPTVEELKENSNIPITTYTFTKENNNFILKNVQVK